MEEGAQDGEHERDAHAPDASSPSLRSSPASPGTKTCIMCSLYMDLYINYLYLQVHEHKYVYCI